MDLPLGGFDQAKNIFPVIPNSWIANVPKPLSDLAYQDGHLQLIEDGVSVEVDESEARRRHIDVGGEQSLRAPVRIGNLGDRFSPL
jgi:hypothetical protein